MGINCIVKDCRSEWYPACDVIFHKFPSDVRERKKWLAIVPLKRPFSESAKICSLHFKASNYNKSGKKLLIGITPFYQEINEEMAVETKKPAIKIFEQKQINMPSSSLHMMLPLLDTTALHENVQENTAPYMDAKTKEPASLINEEIVNMPSTSQHILTPLRDATARRENSQECYTPPSKKSRLFEILTTPIQADKKHIQVNQSTSPVEFGVDKNIQTRLKTPRENSLEKKNKLLAQRIVRLNKSVNSMKSLIKIVKSYTSKSEIENIINGNFANICEHFKKPSKRSPQGVRYSAEIKSFAITLHLYSPKAYDFLRKYVALPHADHKAFSLNI